MLNYEKDGYMGRSGDGIKTKMHQTSDQDVKVGKRCACLLSCHIKITTELQNSHHWESSVVWLNLSPTTGNIHKRPPGDW